MKDSLKKQYYKIATNSTEEWLAIKDKTIGGSEASAVVGKSKWQTPNDVYNKIVLGKRKKVVVNSRILDGVASEPIIAKQFAIDDKRFKIKHQTKKYILYIRKDKPYLSVTPDRLATFLPTGVNVGIEIKDIEVKNKKEREDWERGLLPDQYFFQALHYFVVKTDIQIVIVLAHLNYLKFDEESGRLVHEKSITMPYMLYREELSKEIEWLENQETKFWNENIVKKNRPPMVIG